MQYACSHHASIMQSCCMMDALALFEDYVTGRVRRDQVFRDMRISWPMMTTANSEAISISLEPCCWICALNHAQHWKGQTDRALPSWYWPKSSWFWEFWQATDCWPTGKFIILHSVFFFSFFLGALQF